jgi:hypothetical protein
VRARLPPSVRADQSSRLDASCLPVSRKRTARHAPAHEMVTGAAAPRGPCGTEIVTAQELAQCWLIVDPGLGGTEIIKMLGVAASCDALTGMPYRADVQEHSRYCSR